MKNFLKILNDTDFKIKKIDYIIMGIMVLVYGILSFYRLGDMSSPKTFHNFNDNNEIVVNLNNENYVSKMRYYTGYNIGDISIWIKSGDGDYQFLKDFTTNSVLSYEDVLIDTSFNSIKFVGKTDGVTLGDIAFYDNFENRINIPKQDGPLTDETSLIPKKISYMNSLYFDEVYFARSAYEYTHGLDAFEWSHPPVAKLIMSIPVLIFGFSPFTVRLMGNIAGILLIPIMYILCKKLFKNRKYALLGAIIMMFDNFHFADTRIALSDSFQILFILLSVIFMVNYFNLGKKDSFKKKTINLLLSGLFIGLAIGVKWNALYVALGLAIVFFRHLFKEYHVNVIKYIKNIKINTWINIVSCLLLPVMLYYLFFLVFDSQIAKVIVIIYFVIIIGYLLFKFIKFLRKDKDLFKLFIVCVISFIMIPMVIYILSYLLFPNLSYYDGTFSGIFKINKMMYDYHANLEATHPFTSKWYEWPIMYKPVWLYSGEMVNGFRETIVDIGNPLVWWFGILGFIYLVVSAIKKNNLSRFILIFILSSFIPYIFIGRIMFMYHYFITLPFVMLGIVSLIKWLVEKTKSDKVYWIYIYSVIIMFFIFYPVVSGMSIESDYIESLKWLSSWYF